MTEKEQRQPQHLFPCLTSPPPHSSGLLGEKEGGTAGGSEQGVAVEMEMRADRQVGHAAA